MQVKIHIDGSCVGQGTPLAEAGYGVAIRGAMHADLLGKLDSSVVQDSNRAEAVALLEAVKWLRQYPAVKAVIYTDSDSVAKAAHGMINRLADGEEKAFWKMTKDIFADIKSQVALLAPGQLMNIKWIPREENEQANALARRAVNALILVDKADLPDFNYA